MVERGQSCLLPEIDTAPISHTAIVLKVIAFATVTKAVLNELTNTSKKGNNDITCIGIITLRSAGLLQSTN